LASQGEQFTATNVPLSHLVAFAYQRASDGDPQLVGLPTWTRTSSYDIVGQAPAGVALAMPISVPFLPDRAPQTVAPMLRTLLADRFKLKLHTEMREVPTYSLVMARADRMAGSAFL
jgi:uncharacterized protein (TIGR03435 family)